MFPTLKALVEHYKENQDGLVRKLATPCTRTEKPFNDLSRQVCGSSTGELEGVG